MLAVQHSTIEREIMTRFNRHRGDSEAGCKIVEADRSNFLFGQNLQQLSACPSTMNADKFTAFHVIDNPQKNIQLKSFCWRSFARKIEPNLPNEFTTSGQCSEVLNFLSSFFHT